MKKNSNSKMIPAIKESENKVMIKKIMKSVAESFFRCIPDACPGETYETTVSHKNYTFRLLLQCINETSLRVQIFKLELDQGFDSVKGLHFGMLENCAKGIKLFNRKDFERIVIHRQENSIDKNLLAKFLQSKYKELYETIVNKNENDKTMLINNSSNTEKKFRDIHYDSKYAKNSIEHLKNNNIDYKSMYTAIDSSLEELKNNEEAFKNIETKVASNYILEKIIKEGI